MLTTIENEAKTRRYFEAVWNERRLRIERRVRSWCRLKQWYKHHLRPGLRGVSTAQRIVQLIKASGFHHRKWLLRRGREGI